MTALQVFDSLMLMQPRVDYPGSYVVPRKTFFQQQNTEMIGDCHVILTLFQKFSQESKSIRIN